MIKIKAGKSIIEYAAMVGAPVDEVVKWVSDFINCPSDSQKKWSPNSTEQSRALEIKEYIEMRLDTSIKETIKDELLRERIANAKTITNPAECPF